MKLRLPHKFQAALMAALASVSFTTLSTGSQAFADEALITTTFSQTGTGKDQWTANSVTSFTLTTDDWKLTKIDGTEIGNKSNDKQLRPNTNVQSESGWKLSFDVNNTGSDAVTITGITIDSFLFTGTNQYQSNNTARHFIISLTDGTQTYSTEDITITATNDGPHPTNGVVTLTFANAITLSGTQSQNLTLTVDKATQTDGCFVGLNNLVVNGSATLPSYTWAATGASAWTDTVWKTSTEERLVDFVAGSDAVFDSTGYAQVGITSAVSARNVTVGGKDYTFTLSGDDASLTAHALTVTDGKLTIDGNGDVSISSLAGAGGFVKDSSGTLVLNGNNSSYSGAITVNAGVVHVTQVSSLGTGTLTVNEGGTIRIATRNSGTGLPTSLSVEGNGNLSLMTDKAGSGDDAANIDLKTVSAKNLYLHAEGGDANGYNSRFIYKSGSDLAGVEHLFFDGAQMWVQANMDFTHAVTFGATTYYESAAAFNKAALRVGNGNAPVAKFSGPIEIQDTFKAGWQGNGELVFAGAVTGTAAIDLASFSGNGKFTVSGDASTNFSGTVTSAAAITLNVTSTGSLCIGSGSNLAGAVTLDGALTVNDAATISGNITGSGTLTKNGDGTLTLSGNNSGFTGTTTVNAGTLSMNGGSLGGTLTVGENAEATFSGAVTLASHIQNSGSVVFNSGSTLTLTCGLDDLEGETTYTDGESGFISGVEKSIASGAGTVTGLTSVTIDGATYTKDAGQITDDGAISIHDTNYTTYYLRTEGAEVDVPAEQALHTEFTKIDVAGKDGTTVTGNILVNGTVSLDSLNIAAGNTASVALSEGATTATANITALTHDGTLAIGSGVTVHYAPTTLTMAAGKTLTTTGAGTFEVTTLTVTGGTLNISSDMKVTGGDDGKGGTKNHQGLAVTGNNGTVNILNGVTTVTGAVYAGTGNSATTLALNVGTGDNAAVLVARRVELGDSNGGTATFTIGQHGKVVVTGNEDIRTGGNPQKNTSLQMSEWNQVVTSTIQGELFAREATAFMSNDTASIINVNGGTMAVKGIATTNSGTAVNHTLSVTNGGKLVLGATGIAAEAGTWAITLDGSEIGMTADTTLGRAMTLSGTANFNTTKYAWSGEDADLALNAGTAGGTMTVSGNLSGAGKLIADGAGTLVLSGTNTYSGGTEVNGGTLQVASAGALGSGDVTVNGGTLELTSSVTITGALTLGTNSTLVFAGENMLTAGSLSAGTGVVFDLSNITATKHGTITLASGTGGAGELTGVTVNWVMPTGFDYGNLRAEDGKWLIDVISTGQALTWNGGTTGNWSYSEEDTPWLTPGDDPQAAYFTDKDSAVFSQAGSPAVANIKEDITTTGVVVEAGADVTLQSNEGASLNVADLEIAGSLNTSADVAATAVEAADANAAWNITAGSVTADSISVAENGKLALSGTGMEVKTVSGPGTVEVGRGFTLTLSQQIDSEQATDLSIRNNGTVVVELGSSQNVINMDTASTGTLEVTAGTISSQSALGAGQTLKLAAGTVFAVKGSETAFASDITLAGNVAMQLKDGANATIAGAVSGEGQTLSVSGGAANQVVTFTDTVTLGGLNVSGSGEKLVFQGTGSSLGAIYAQSGAFTIQFSKADGDETASHTFGTFAMAPTSGGARWLIVDNGVTVQGTGNGLSESSTICSAYDVSGGGLDVNGTLQLAGKIGFDGPGNSTIKGSGLIETTGLNISNGTTTTIQGGVVIDITSDAGVYKRAGGNSTLNLANATLKATSVNWEMKTSVNTVNLTDASTGTAFDAAKDHTITLSKAMGGSGKLVKKGEGTVLANAANTYTGGTVINAGTLATNNNTALGTGDVNIADGTLEMRSSLTIAGDLTGTGDITYTGNEAGTLSLTKNQTHQTLAMDIGSAAGAGALNLTLNSNSDYKFSGDVDVNNINHHTNSTVFVLDEGDVTITGTVLTGRLVVGEQSTETGAVFTLSGENAMLVYTADADHTYTAAVEGYGTFQLIGGATQTLTGENKLTNFHGTFAADGQGSVLTLSSALASDVTFKATNGGEIVLTQTYTMGDNTAVDGGTVKVSNGLTVNGTVDLSKGTLTQTGGTITVNTDKSLTLGNASITSAITNSGAVAFTQDITATGLAEASEQYSVGADDERSTNGNFFYQGKRTEGTLTVVTGGGTVTTGGIKVTQGGHVYTLKDDGTATGVTADGVDYSTFYQGEAGTTVSVSEIAATAAKHNANLLGVYSLGSYPAPTVLNVDQDVKNVMLGFATMNIDEDVNFTGDLLIFGGMNTVSGQVGTEQLGFFAAQDSVTTFTDAPIQNGGVTFTSDQGAGGVVVQAYKVADDDENYYYYAINDGHYAVIASELSKEGESASNVANSLQVQRVHNSKASSTGKLTLSAGAFNMSLNEVIATSGDVEFLNMAAANATTEGKQTSVSLNKLEIGAGKTVSFYEATAPTSVEDMVRECAVTVTGTLTAGEGATLNAGLNMVSGSHLDVSGAQGSMGLIMGSPVTLNSGMYLDVAGYTQDQVSGYLYDYLSSGEHDLYYLYIGQAGDPIELTINGVLQQADLDKRSWNDYDMDANTIYANLQAQTFYVRYDGSNVGMVAIGLIPEPTTSTLSLLALCALAARRRRK